MKSIYILILSILSVPLLLGAEQVDTIGSGDIRAGAESLSEIEEQQIDTVDADASQAYRDGNFAESIRLYEERIAAARADGVESAQLYYNLGNAYYRSNNLGNAILNYERALLLDPGDGDTRHNLRIANSQIVDEITPAGSLIFSRIYRSIRNMLSSNAWANLSIVLFIAFLGLVALYLFSDKIWLKKLSFYLGIVLFILSILSTQFSFSQKRELQNRTNAIILAKSVGVNASPDDNSNQLFELHEGSKVKIRDSDGDWYEIKIANGSVGWIRKYNLEII